MSQKIEKIISQFPEIELVKDSNIEVWKQVENDFRFLPLKYQRGFVEYQSLYFDEAKKDFEEISLLIKSGNHYIGLWPICIWSENQQYKIGSLGGEIVAPLFVEKMNLTAKTRRKKYKMLFSLLNKICDEYDISEMAFEEIVFGGVDEWHRYLMEEGAEVFHVTHEAYCDLELDIEEILKKMHKSTQQRIKGAEKLYSYEIVDGQSANLNEMMKKFREYHIEVAGRETRGIQTWQKQCSNIKSYNDFLVILYDKETNEIDGISLYTVTQSHCYYSVAVYNRDKFNRPLGHLAQYIAINHLKELGVKYYDVGDRFYGCDGVDEKMLAISMYKEAFSTEMRLKLHLRVKRGE